MIGINDIRKRYARSKIGQLWITLSLAINILALGIVWSYLFKMPVLEYLPHLATGTIFWTYISSSITEGGNLYIVSANYLRELTIPKTSYINSLFVRSIIVLLHNLVVLIPIFIICPVTIHLNGIFISLIGIILTSFFLFPVVMLTSIFSLRYRDFINIIASLLQIVYYFTPIMWKVELLSPRLQKYIILNPFAIFLSICRDPLCATSISLEYWVMAIIYVILAWIIVFPIFCKYRGRLVYWL